jgi:hypothetical protein
MSHAPAALSDINFRGGHRHPFERLSSVRHSRGGHLDAVATERDALGDEALALARSLGQRAVGSHHTPPGQVGLVALEEDRSGEARGTGRDVAVGADEAGRDLADAVEDFEQARFGGSGQAAGPKASMMRFWYSESSSGEMK